MVLLQVGDPARELAPRLGYALAAIAGALAWDQRGARVSSGLGACSALTAVVRPAAAYR